MDDSDGSALRQPKKRKTPAATFGQRLEYGLVRGVGFILARVPVGVASAMIGGLLWLVMPLTSRHKRALENLAFALPDMSVRERKAIARGMWMHLGRVAGEAFQIETLTKDPSRLELPADFDRFTALSANGVIGATPHLGNWEIAAVLSRAGGLKLAGVYQALHNPLVEEHLRAMRLPAYPGGLFSKGPELGHTLLSLARNGYGIGIVADFREMRGVGVMFFGHPAFATPLPAMLARASGRPLIAGAVVRTGGTRFRALMEEITVPHTSSREDDIAVAIQSLHTVFERWIRQYPEQWMWTHRKWARSRRRELTVRDVSFPAALPAETPGSNGTVKRP
ncbi:MAG: lauroyl acyltransferase [Pseudomonadota bacterium]